MPIPDFQSLMRPCLEILADGQEHQAASITESLALSFKLSDEERKELLPSGKQARFINRVSWAKGYLKKAGLLTSPSRGVLKITLRGQQVLESQEHINIAYLNRFAEFRAFRERVPSNVDVANTPQAISEKAPEEVISEKVFELEQALAQDLLERIMASPPKLFERLVIDLLLAMGYGGSRKEAGRAIGKAGDEGIDGIINEDRLGLDSIYLQAKRWAAPVDAKTVREFGGALMGQGATKGVLITPSSFTGAAVEYASKLKQVKMVLIDGNQLARLMIQHNIGVAEAERYVLKKVDLDYFEAE